MSLIKKVGIIALVSGAIGVFFVPFNEVEPSPTVSQALRDDLNEKKYLWDDKF